MDDLRYVGPDISRLRCLTLSFNEGSLATPPPRENLGVFLSGLHALEIVHL